jgi:hypothetical protein
MKITFKATEFGTDDDGYALVCGASNSASEEDEYHYFTLQRSSDPEDEDDWGIHFEIDDQINGGYNLLKSCEYNTKSVHLFLYKGTDWYPELREIEVILPNDDQGYEIFTKALSRIFHDRKEDLKSTI